MGGVIGRGVAERDRELDPRRTPRWHSEESCKARLLGEPEKLVPRSVLVLVVLPEPRRLGNEKGNLDEED